MYTYRGLYCLSEPCFSRRAISSYRIRRSSTYIRIAKAAAVSAVEGKAASLMVYLLDAGRAFYIHIHTYIYMNKYKYIYVCTNINILRSIYKYTYMYIHTYIYVYIQTSISSKTFMISCGVSAV
jgi:hypothetical protein